jgi:hypothetical protein
MLGHEFGHIVSFGIEHYPTRFLVIVLRDFSSINVSHVCQNPNQ